MKNWGDCERRGRYTLIQRAGMTASCSHPVLKTKKSKKKYDFDTKRVDAPAD